MEPNRDSLICIKSANFKPEAVQFEIGYRMDFGKPQVTEVLKTITDLGVSPPENTAVLVHEFTTEEGAKQAAEKIEFFMGEGSPFGPTVSMFAGKPVVKGKQLIMSAKVPEPMAAPLGILEPLAAALGELASNHQFFEVKLSASKTLKEILTNTAVSPLASFLDAFCFKVSLNHNKELPIKLAEFFATMAPGEEEKIKTVGHVVSSFHHLKFEVDLRDASEEMKGLLKAEIQAALPQGAMMALGMAGQFGLLEIAKLGGIKTVIYANASPLIKFEFSILMPTAIDTVEALAGMMGGPGM